MVPIILGEVVPMILGGSGSNHSWGKWFLSFLGEVVPIILGGTFKSLYYKRVRAGQLWRPANLREGFSKHGFIHIFWSSDVDNIFILQL